MSVIIPVVLGFLIFGDTATFYKIAGTIIGLLAFYLTFKKEKPAIKNTGYALLPLFLFLVVGINDSMMKVAEHYFIGDDFVVFLATAFGVALIIGLTIMLIRWKSTIKTFAPKNFFAGIILGLLNWYSTLFFLKGLDLFQVSFFVPVFNVGVVALSALTGYFIFNEKLNKINWFGIVLAIVAILLIAGGMDWGTPPAPGPQSESKDHPKMLIAKGTPPPALTSPYIEKKNNQNILPISAER
jgi:drug/metabolite transporter (DMT)-like permease